MNDKEKILENSYYNIAEKRSRTIINYISMLIALSKNNNLNKTDLINWIHSKFEQFGYFQEKKNSFSDNKLLEFTQEFVQGRALLYDDINVDFIETNKVKVTSGKWYVENPPESFFFFDIDPKEFSSYAQELALINAMKLGIHLDFVDDKDKEIAYISLSNNSESTIDELIIKKADPKSDFSQISNFFEKHWGGTTMVSRGNAFNVLDEEIILAKRNKRIVGILVYSKQGSNIEILTLEAIEKYHNIGSLLLEKLEEIAVNKNIKSINLITSNDNLNAIRFYQRRGFSFKSVHIGAINKAREIKPSIPLIGDYGIKISDEIEFEKRVY